MKLLKRAEVASQAAELKRQQVSEGMELVERVNALRKALADLQQQQRNFVEASKEELKRETTELFGQKESLKAEVISLTTVREELKKPLIKEWNELKANQDKFAKEKSEVSTRVEKLEKDEVKVKYLMAQKESSLQKALEAEQQVNERNKQAERDRISAEEVLKTSQNVAKGIYERVAEREKEIARKEEKVNFDLQANEHVKEINERKEKELNIRERQINDKYATLQRTIKRNGK